MASIPLLVGDEAVGVFNAVTNRADAFDVADITYLTSLGAVIATAVGIAVKGENGAEGGDRVYRVSGRDGGFR